MTYISQPELDKAARADRYIDVRPLPLWQVSDTLANGLTAQAGAPTTYYYYVDMYSFRRAGFQFIWDGGTANNTSVITCEGTMQDDGTVRGSCSYHDVTNDLYGVASLSVAGGATATDTWVDTTESGGGFKYLRIKVVLDTTSGADDVAYTIFHKRLY